MGRRSKWELWNKRFPSTSNFNVCVAGNTILVHDKPDQITELDAYGDILRVITGLKLANRPRVSCAFEWLDHNLIVQAWEKDLQLVDIATKKVYQIGDHSRYYWASHVRVDSKLRIITANGMSQVFMFKIGPEIDKDEEKFWSNLAKNKNFADISIVHAVDSLEPRKKAKK
jgi:hypothetical protein